MQNICERPQEKGTWCELRPQANFPAERFLWSWGEKLDLEMSMDYCIWCHDEQILSAEVYICVNKRREVAL